MTENNKEDNFRNNTESKLYCANFNHHDPNLCVCNECTCGRHLCKLHAIAPDMSKGTVYRQSFRKTKGVPSLVLKAEDAPKLKGDHLDINSIQKKDFSGRKGDSTERPRPQADEAPNLFHHDSQIQRYPGDATGPREMPSEPAIIRARAIPNRARLERHNLHKQTEYTGSIKEEPRLTMNYLNGRPITEQGAECVIKATDPDEIRRAATPGECRQQSPRR